MAANPAFFPLGPRFEEALLYAARVHALQRRKGTTIPYITHPLAVAAIVGEGGGDEDEIIAALLHDAVEDQGGAARLADIRAFRRRGRRDRRGLHRRGVPDMARDEGGLRGAARGRPARRPARLVRR